MGKEEKEQELADDVTEMGPPPPYEGAPEYSGRFPRVFNLYATTRLSSTPNYTIAKPRSEQAPLFFVETHWSLSSKPDITLHSGPAETSPPLAIAKLHNFKTSMDLTLSESGFEAHMKHGSWFKSTKYTFMLPVNGQPEPFEWRHSHSDAVKAATGRRAGYKLVRLGHGSATNGAESSDGGEIVAAAGEARWFTGKKACQFQFLGSGLSGELGDQWAVGAVMSGIALYVYLWRQEQAGASAAASSSASVSVSA